MAPFFTHMRSVCPWNEKLSPKGWTKIERPVYDNKMLLAVAERVPGMIVSEEYLDKTYAHAKPRTSTANEPRITIKGVATGKDDDPRMGLMAAAPATMTAPVDNTIAQPPVLGTQKPSIDLKKVVVVLN